MKHSPTTITGDTLVSYLPSSFWHEEKLASIRLVEDIRRAVMRSLPIGFSYNGESRIAIPANLFLQDKTGTRVTEIRHPVTGYPNKMTVETRWARKAIGFDALQVLDKSGAEDAWKTFHIDRVDNLRLLILQEVEKAFPHLNDEDYMTTPSEPPEWHVRNWNWWFRRFMVEREDGRYDLRVPDTFFGSDLHSEEKSI